MAVSVAGKFLPISNLCVTQNVANECCARAIISCHLYVPSVSCVHGSYGFFNG